MCIIYIYIYIYIYVIIHTRTHTHTLSLSLSPHLCVCMCIYTHISVPAKSIPALYNFRGWDLQAAVGRSISRFGGLRCTVKGFTV